MPSAIIKKKKKEKKKKREKKKKKEKKKRKKRKLEKNELSPRVNGIWQYRPEKTLETCNPLQSFNNTRWKFYDAKTKCNRNNAIIKKQFIILDKNGRNLRTFQPYKTR